MTSAGPFFARRPGTRTGARKSRKELQMWWRLRLALLSPLAAVLAACTVSTVGHAPADPRGDPGTGAEAQESPRVEPQALCASTGVRCGKAGPAQVPYVLVSSGGSDRAGPMVLVEPGGPGLDLASAVEGAANLLGDRKIDYLVVGEPWTSSGPSAACLQALRDRLATLGIARATTPLNASCAEASWWRPGQYAMTLRDAQAQLGRKVDLVVAASFGAVRATEALPAVGLAPLIVLTPAAMPGTPRADVLATRAAVVPKALTQPKGDERAAADAVLASLAAAYSSDSSKQVTRLLAAWPRLEPVATQQLRRLALAATYRYGDGDVLPNQAGYLDGFCAAYPGPGGGPAASFPERVLDEVHSCLGRDVAPAVMTEPVDSARQKGCLLLDQLDTVTPASWGGRWSEWAPGLQVHRYRSGQHGAPPQAFHQALSRVLSGRSCFS